MDDAQFAIDLHMVGTEIALWSGDLAAAFEVARDGLDRLVEMDDAVPGLASWRCPRCMPRPTLPSEPERRAIRPRQRRLSATLER